MRRSEPTKEIYSVGEVADLLGVSEPAVRKWLQDGSVRGVKVKRKWFIPVEQIKDLFAMAGLELPSKPEGLIVVVGGTKGGPGKTTLATNLAAAHALNGRDILLLDADKQGSTAMWAGWRDEGRVQPRVPCLQKRGQGLDAELKELSARYGTVIVDAGGYDNRELWLAVGVAHVFVIPIIPSQYDVAELAKMVPLIVEHDRVNPKLRSIVIMNKVHPHPKSSEIGMTRRTLLQIPEIAAEQRPYIHVSPFVIRDRIAFRSTVPSGLSVIEGQPMDSKAVQELQAVYTEVFERGFAETATS